MAINLSKGVNVNLTKEAPALVKILVGLGWKPKATDGADFDLDATAILLNDQNKISNEKDFVFYNNKVSTCKSTYTEGDNLTGVGEGDDESLHVDLSKVPDTVSKIAFAVSIYHAAERKQNFGQVGDAYIRILNEETKEVIAQFDLDEDASAATTLIFGELYRNNGDWKFKAIGDSIAAASVADIVSLYS
jgi:tellurium resistance protein TerD